MLRARANLSVRICLLIRAYRLKQAQHRYFPRPEAILVQKGKFSAQHNSEGIGLEREFPVGPGIDDGDGGATAIIIGKVYE